MIPLRILFLVCLIQGCREREIIQLSLPEGIDGFKERSKKSAVFYADKYLTTHSSQKPELPHVGSTPILRYYEIPNRKMRAIEAFSNGVTYYMKEADIFFNYASCGPFDNKTLTDLKSLNGFVLGGKLANQFYQKNRSYQGKSIGSPLGSTDILGYDSFSIKIAGRIYYVQILDKLIGYCEGAHPITQVLDYIALPDNEQDTNELISFCLQLENSENSIYAFKSNGTDEKTGFFSVIDAWRFDIKSLKWEHVKSNLPKCYNECAKGCD